MMKKALTIVSIGLLCLSLVAGAFAVSAASAGYEGVSGFYKAYDFDNYSGVVKSNSGNTAVSPLRGTGGYTATVTDEWNYFGDSGNSLKLSGTTAHGGCFQLELPHDDTNGYITFSKTAYRTIYMAVKAPSAPATGADGRGFTLDLALNDWGTYYKMLKAGDKYYLKAVGTDEWKAVGVTADHCVCLPYGFEGQVKLDLGTFYKGSTATAANLLADYAIQHELLIEAWLPSFNGSAQGGFYIDDVYLATAGATEPTMKPTTKPTTKSTTAIPTVPTNPATPVSGALELSDYESFTVGDIVAGVNEETDAIWNGYGFTVKASDKFTGNGKVSLEFSSETQRKMAWAIIATLKAKETDLSGKTSIVFHLATPSEDSTKGPAYQDAQGNPRFAFALLPVADGHWFKSNTTVSGNVQMMPDGEATWKNMPGDDFYNYLPFGWSGWIKYDLSKMSDNGTPFSDQMPLAYLEFWASQCGMKFGNIYLDSFYAMNAQDVLECGLTVAGNANGRDPETTGTTGTTGTLYIPTFDDDGTDPTAPAGGTETENDNDISGENGYDDPGEVPDTGDAPFAVIAVLLVLMGTLGVLVTRRDRVR